MIKIDKGEKKIFYVDLRLANGRPFDLTGYDKLRASIPKGSDDKLEITQTVNGNGSLVEVSGNVILGVLKITVGKNDSKNLVEGERLYLDIEIDKTATPGPIRERFVDALNVVDNLCTVT